MDPSIAPAVAAPCPGGVTFDQARRLIHGLVRKGRVVGMDVVEITPRDDVNQITCITAGRLIVNLIGMAVPGGCFERTRPSGPCCRPLQRGCLMPWPWRAAGGQIRLWPGPAGAAGGGARQCRRLDLGAAGNARRMCNPWLCCRGARSSGEIECGRGQRACNRPRYGGEECLRIRMMRRR